MAVTVRILTRVGGRPNLVLSRTIEQTRFNFGRDESCTFALADPQKHISRFHVEVAEEVGVWWMTVVSKVNPVVVKGVRHGPGTRLTMASGDAFEIGEYEIQVALAEPVERERPAKRPEATPSRVTSTIPPRVNDPLIRLLSPTEGSTAPAPADDIFDEPTYIGAAPGGAMPAPRPAASASRAAPAAAPSRPSPAPALSPRAEPAADPNAGLERALRALFQGIGLPYRDVSPAAAERMLHDCGALLRAAIDGIMMLLVARAELRKELHAEDRTMVAARDNNPLKLMSDSHEAMAFLFDPSEQTDGFLDPVHAVSDALDDLRTHEMALIAGMQAAILGVIRRFDPKALERAFDQSGSGFSLASKSSRLWELFEAHHAKLSYDAQEDFNKVFGRDFMTAYQAQLRRSRGGR